MRWLMWFILAYLILGLQLGIAEDVRVGGARPNLVLLAVIFIALSAPREAALLGCFGMGVMHDLTTLQPLGLYALSYALVAMFVISTQEIVYREHPVTHVSLAFVAGSLTAIVMLAHAWTRGPSVGIAELFTEILYTTAVAPAMLWLLQRSRRIFGFAPRKRLRTV